MRPRIRTIKPEFFKHEKVRAVPRQVRFTMVGLISAADDRGRIEFLLPALRGFIYPGGDVSERQLNGEIEKIVSVRFAVSYVVGLSAYLWIPNFWRHQRINRPTESELPPHPDDPYRGFPVHEAIEKFTEDERSGHGGFSEDSLSNHGALSPSRAGARSSSNSFPTPTPSPRRQVDARARSKRADQDALPLSLPGELHHAAHLVLSVLRGVQSERGGNEPTIRGVGLAVQRFPNRDHAGVARQLEHWALAGTGQAKPVADWARTFATFLERSPAGKPVRVGDVVALPRSPVLDRADAWKAGYEEDAS